MSEAETLADQLRRTTRPLHRRLDSNPLMRRLVGKDLTRSDYHLILRTFYVLYAALEEELVARIDWNALKIDFSKRLKVPMLARDLAALAIDIRPLTPCPQVPKLLSEGEALGCFYVLEGATLGGQYISRNLGLQLGLGVDNGAAFFASYGDEVGPMWQSTLEALALYERHHSGDHGCVVRGACATFEAFATSLNLAQD